MPGQVARPADALRDRDRLHCSPIMAIEQVWLLDGLSNRRIEPPDLLLHPEMGTRWMTAKKKFAGPSPPIPPGIAARAKSEGRGGPLVASITNSILTPTKFSALK